MSLRCRGKIALFATLLFSVWSTVNAASMIQGTIIDQAGSPIEGARVWFAGSNAKTCTNKQGKYSLPSREKYIYTVRAVRSNFSESQALVVATNGVRHADLVMYQNSSKAFSDCRIRAIKQSKPFWHADDEQRPSRIRGMIRGIVVDAHSNQLLSGVKITTRPATASITTDSNGSYAIYQRVWPGLYQVIATRDGFEQGVAQVRVMPTNEGGVSSVQADIVMQAVTDNGSGSSPGSRSNAEGQSNIEDFEREEQQIDSAEGQSNHEE